MKDRIVNSFLDNWVSIDEQDVILVQFYTFLFTWLDSSGLLTWTM